MGKRLEIFCEVRMKFCDINPTSGRFCLSTCRSAREGLRLRQQSRSSNGVSSITVFYLACVAWFKNCALSHMRYCTAGTEASRVREDG